MSLPEQVQASRKKAQLARLAAKGSPEYPAIYAAQPDQIRRAAEQGAVRQKVREAKAAAVTEASLDADAAIAAFGGISTKRKGEK